MKKLYKNRLFFLFTRLKTHRDQRRESSHRLNEEEKMKRILLLLLLPFDCSYRFRMENRFSHPYVSRIISHQLPWRIALVLI